MLTIYLESGTHGKLKIAEVFHPASGEQLMEKINEFGIDCSNYFFKSNGRLVEFDDIVYNGDLSLEPRLCGGKGGFGSMLRAIGAQIEKTTNREACRDLSGRRLRDINEEKRLKAWIDKQSKREEEAAERKKRKLAKLCAEPKHEFKDKSYDEQRSALAERVEDAVEVGFAAASTSATKRAADESAKTNPKKKKKTILDLEDDIDSDDLDSSDESSDEKEADKKQTSNSKSDTENSSDSASSKSKPTNESPKSSSSHTDDTSR
ncbi:hypothetical protein TSAR_011326 [Trichomalopsis sarcophagae]|uniref:SDE2-like domain-containing protein n=1 Tax=Trichomalopsis sarcophagae TaxID=543379 RepID=A0A232EWK3_9HYME|nr:hypothetical protein TSAR_011326 [Trichomalopsis sarcophagae]